MSKHKVGIIGKDADVESKPSTYLIWWSNTDGLKTKEFIDLIDLAQYLGNHTVSWDSYAIFCGKFIKNLPEEAYTTIEYDDLASEAYPESDIGIASMEEIEDLD